jgi:hypothetical protein
MAIQYERKGTFVNIYDLGRAHGRQVYNNFADFKLKILEVIEQNKDIGKYVAVTNRQQEQEAKWLEEIGFDQTTVGEGYQALIVHVTSYEKLIGGAPEKLERFRAEAKARAEKLRKEREARLAARPRNEEGRLLRKDGFVIRRPYEFFVGDTVLIHNYNSVTFSYERIQGQITHIEGNNIRVNSSPHSFSKYHIDLITRAR